jgi:uncharacterized membrane protein
LRRGGVAPPCAETEEATMSQPAIVTTNNPAEIDTAKIIYVLYLVGWVIPVIPPIIGLIMAYINRDDAPVWVQSHYQLQIRTFWIGVVYFIISLLTTMILIGWFVLFLMVIWWIIRCVKGLKALFDGVPYPNATTWLW